MTDINNLVQIEISKIVDRFARESRSQLAQAMDNFKRSLDAKNSSVNTAMRKLHEHVAEGSKDTIITAYQTSGIGKRPSYRDADPGKLKRYSRGAMERALSSGGLITFDAHRLNFIDKDIMDRNAKQWYRLNFGAGAAGRGGLNNTTPWKLGGKTISFTVSLASYAPSKPFRIPEGFMTSGVWSSKAYARTPTLRTVRNNPGGGAFYVFPMRKGGGGLGGRTPLPGTFRGGFTKGIVAHNFLDKGVEYINTEYPKQLTSLLNTWFTTATDSLGRKKPFTWEPI